MQNIHPRLHHESLVPWPGVFPLFIYLFGFESPSVEQQKKIQKMLKLVFLIFILG
jgi:hypothetical protein